ncbi:MAG TPA: TonB-dependent receptor [Chitinophagales bacterium]|nr:TonB-dependent receptor [Chitinophagales bacterium]
MNDCLHHFFNTRLIAKSVVGHSGTYTSRFSLLLLLVALLFCFNADVNAQDNGVVSITVAQKDNSQPIEDVIVLATPVSVATKQTKNITGITDGRGTFQFHFTEPVVVRISHLGYVTVLDTFFTPATKLYELTSVQSIRDVVVTGQYAAGSTLKSIYPVQVITMEELKVKGANNLREALQGKLNIDLGQDQLYGSSLSINGISGEGIKIMVDGVPVVGRLDGKLDLSQINLNNIDHIEIVEGPLSVIYGTDALGGVINIITKNFQNEKVNINLKGYYETVGQYNVELNTGFAFKKSQLYLSGGRNFFGGYTTIDSLLRYREWKPKEQYFADAKYVFSNNRLRFSLTGSFFREMMLDRSAPALDFDTTDKAWTYKGTDSHILTYRPRATASLMYRFKENSQLDVLLGYSSWYRFSTKYSKNLVSGEERPVEANDDRDTARYHQITGRATYSIPAWKYRLNFLFGIDINQEFVWQNRIAGNKKQIGDYAAFGSARISVIEGLDIQPGIRFAYNTQFGTPLIPSLNIKYNWKDRVVFRAAYGRGFRVPSVKELFLDFLITAHYLKGNPDLKPEDGHNASTSVNYYFAKEKHKLNITASGFFNYIFNKIELVNQPTVGTTPVYKYFNYKKYSTYGGQFAANYRWERLQASASVQFTGYNIVYQNTGTGILKTWSPDVSATISYLIPKAELNLYVGYKYNGIKPLFSVGTQFQAGRRLAYHLLDVSLSRSFWKDKIQITIGGKNLAGVKNVKTENVEVLGHSANPNEMNVGWGQTFFTSLILHFSK